jgi:FAD/FMN-containing dehydrogenase
VGGIAALGACGPERLRYGAPRDLLLGLKFVSGSGRLIAAGGRVVKNVTGYDVTRLLAGSAGTLGFLTELTFRVLSLPACCAAVFGSGPLAACGAAATALLQSKLEPNFVVAVPSNVALQVSPGAEWRLMVGFEGFPETVAWQAAQGQTLIAQVGLAAPERRAYAPREGACREFFDTLDRAPFLLRLDLPLNSVTAFLSHPPQPLDGAAVLADFGCGRVVLATPEMTGARWLAQAQRVEQLAGRAVLEKAPLAFRREHDVFGRPRPDWPLMHRLKAALDPHHVFSPGAMPGRL